MTVQPADTAAPAVAAVSISVVICCYTTERRAGLARAVDSVVAQLGVGDELIVVVDGNDALHRELRTHAPSGVVVVANTASRGLSGARNTGLRTASGDVVVFLDDDAALHPAALAGVRAAYLDPGVVGVGGAVHPEWPRGSAPRWFPPEFGWVVGCDYRGLPCDGADIRNPIGAAMAVRRAELVGIGGFSDRLGRVGTLPTGCEETLMGIELVRHHPTTRIVRHAAFSVSHTVSADRVTLSYFLRRCFHEGRSKAILTRLCGQRSSLASERRYTTQTLPTGLWHARRRPGRMLALLAGLTTTAGGYLTGLIQTASQGE